METVLHNVIELYIWPLTLGACTSAIVVFITLVIRRCWDDKRNAQRAARKKAINQALLVHLASPLRDLRSALVHEPKDLALLAEVLPPLLATLGGQSRRNLLAAIRDVGFCEWLYRSLNSVHIVTQPHLIRLAGHWPETDVLQRLYSLIRCGYPALRASAAEALASTGDARHLPAVMQELSSVHWQSAPVICDILRRFGAVIAPELLLFLKAPSEQQALPSPNLRLAALMALAELGDEPTVYRVALELCAAQEEPMRACALATLADAGQAVPAHVLTAAARDDSWRVRKSAIACALHADQPDLGLMVSLLSDENWLVGLTAGRALLSQRLGMSGRQLLSAVARGESVAARRAGMILSEPTPAQERRYGMV